MTRVVRSPRSSIRRIGFVSLLALAMALAGRVPSAMAQGVAMPQIWSIQLHGGMYAPFEGNGASPMLGVRYCKHYSPHLYGGLLSGWTYKRTSVDQPVQDPTNSGPRIQLAQVDAQLVPLMAFMQVNLSNRFLVPLVGVGAGYEWLALNVKDFRTGSESRPTYGNLAWEAYGGVALRLNSKVRLNGELFYNGGSLQRRVIDASGRAWLEDVHVNGVGTRVGLDMDFE